MTRELDPRHDWTFDPDILGNTGIRVYDFFDRLELHYGNVRKAMNDLGIGSFRQVYDRRITDPHFRDVYERVRANGVTTIVELLEDEYLDRTLNGKIEITTETLPNGQVIERIRRTLDAGPIQWLLERRDPERWGPRVVDETSGKSAAEVAKALTDAFKNFRMSDRDEIDGTAVEDAQLELEAGDDQ